MNKTPGILHRYRSWVTMNENNEKPTMIKDGAMEIARGLYSVCPAGLAAEILSAIFTARHKQVNLNDGPEIIDR